MHARLREQSDRSAEVEAAAGQATEVALRDMQVTYIFTVSVSSRCLVQILLQKCYFEGVQRICLCLCAALCKCKMV